jgi:hypothetical protein
MLLVVGSWASCRCNAVGRVIAGQVAGTLDLFAARTNLLEAEPGDPGDPRVTDSDEKIGLLARQRKTFGVCHVGGGGEDGRSWKGL